MMKNVRMPTTAALAALLLGMTTVGAVGCSKSNKADKPATSESLPPDAKDAMKNYSAGQGGRQPATPPGPGR